MIEAAWVVLGARQEMCSCPVAVQVVLLRVVSSCCVPACPAASYLAAIPSYCDLVLLLSLLSGRASRLMSVIERGRDFDGI